MKKKNKILNIILLAVFAIITAAGIWCVIYGFDGIDYIRREEKTIVDVIFGSEDDLPNVRAKGELNMPIEKIEDGYYVFCIINNSYDSVSDAEYTVFGLKAGYFDCKKIDAIIEYVEEESKNNENFDGAAVEKTFNAAGIVRKMRVSEKESFDKVVKDYDLLEGNTSILLLDCRYDNDLAIFFAGVIAIIAGVCGIVLSAPQRESGKKDNTEKGDKGEQPD